MRLKLDENLGHQYVARFRAAGHDVSTVAEQGMTSAPDVAVFAACSAEARAVVTFDLDFAHPVRFDPRGTAGVLVVRLPRQATRAGIQRLVDRLLEALAHTDPRGRL